MTTCVLSDDWASWQLFGKSQDAEWAKNATVFADREFFLAAVRRPLRPRGIPPQADGLQTDGLKTEGLKTDWGIPPGAGATRDLWFWIAILHRFDGLEKRHLFVFDQQGCWMMTPPYLKEL